MSVRGSNWRRVEFEQERISLDHRPIYDGSEDLGEIKTMETPAPLISSIQSDLHSEALNSCLVNRVDGIKVRLLRGHGNRLPRGIQNILSDLVLRSRILTLNRFSGFSATYGKIFKTHILGCPCVVVSSSPEATRLVLVNQAHLFKPTYPPSKERLIGPEAIFFHQGDYHSKLKKLVQATFLPLSIKELIPAIERIFTLDVAILTVFGEFSYMDIKTIKQLYHRLDQGYNSMPLDLPGTQFRQSMKARKQLNENLRREIERRRENNYKGGGGGLLGVMLRSKDKDNHKLSFTDSQIADNIIGVIFAARDTTASVMTWILKYLHDNEELLHAVTREQEGIRGEIAKEERKLTWEDTKKMPLTSRVIQETLRAASVLSFTFREAVEDVEFEGYLIPKGWKVLPLFRSIHHSADFFPHPEKFDPSRFEWRRAAHDGERLEVATLNDGDPFRKAPHFLMPTMEKLSEGWVDEFIRELLDEESPLFVSPEANESEPSLLQSSMMVNFLASKVYSGPTIKDIEDALCITSNDSNPREPNIIESGSYYKCTIPRCSAKKQVERSSKDPDTLVITYEGLHFHFAYSHFFPQTHKHQSPTKKPKKYTSYSEAQNQTEAQRRATESSCPASACLYADDNRS
ncbi:hypothetical protein Sjap_013552 [Stephania japonica]|uniref:WRKY domain-containing protein n=1 Tax=Stephania japonica TaxID=461633 RepID=A0AAP0IYX5_9MAGN